MVPIVEERRIDEVYAGVPDSKFKDDTFIPPCNVEEKPKRSRKKVDA